MISSIPKWVSHLFGNAMRPNVKVLEVHHISPQIKKIRFQGDLSKWDFQTGYACVIRVSETEFRNYTVAYHDRTNGFFDIIFHIHGNTVGSLYINQLRKGDELFVSAPRGKKMYEPDSEKQFVFGDETSLGLACSFIPVLHQHQFQFYFELDAANKNVPLLLGLENFTVFPKNGSFSNENWTHDLPVFKTAGWQGAHFVLTGNVQSMQNLRKVLKKWGAGKIATQGYWLEGKKGL